MGWFDALYADIGDEQDIDRHLSTFSAHVANLRDVLERAGDGALALLDELGTGTDPREGRALAMAVLEALLDRGALVVGTTHLDGLKAFAYARGEAQNASVAFDPATGEPLYRLVYGLAGSSNALDVAERLGVPGEVLERARQYAGGGESGADLLRDLEQAQQEAVRSAERAETLRREWEARLREQEALVAEARRERDAARAEAREVARAAIEEARRELRQAIRRFAEERATQRDAERAVEGAAERLEETLRPEAAPPAPRPPREVVPGAPVFVTSLGRRGRVDSVEPGERKVTVQVGPLRVTVPPEDLQEAGGREAEPVPAPRRVRTEAESGAGDVVLVGCSVDDALARLDKALDRALVAGADGFRVVHGRGTGALRRAVREHLQDAPHVRGLRQEDDAVTWVEMD